MTTETEALRAQFEAWATAAYRLSFDDDTPLKRYLWTAYQAGHAAAAEAPCDLPGGARGGAIAEKMAYNAKRADHTPEARAAAATLRQAIEHEQSKPLTNDVVRDAERYRWLAGFCSSTSEHWGGRWSIVIEGPAPKSHDSEDDLDDAIDAAMLACTGAKEPSDA